ncbi:synemin [Molossus molossus]|uniref:Synemin n=1 Tax=Molossus molossus TaxID=27622 RepID=A0A7J8BMH2_MOLMO|nr:synemin [Molossus molossus]KAF6399470.1 synemin [Molossus molossus]
MMLSWRLTTGPEKAELRELNARLYDYVCRVRELERENLLLEEELRGRRGQGGLEAEGQARWAEEARGLRQQLDELSWATALAEGECDALRRELREVRLLAEEARAARRRLDAELDAQRRELQEALSARAALEALLCRLQAERRGLDAAHEREVRELRALSAGRTVRYSARATRLAAPPPRLQEVHDSYTLLVAESWRETVQLYEDEVRELEAALRRGQESRRQAEEESRLYAQEVEALQRRALELEQLRALLEDELLRMREAYELQAQERQGVIACLEEEKAALTLAMADRLRDYQELVQVKTSLSMEVATYRALLEGESNPEILILTERLENLPQEFRNISYQYTNAALQRENERNLFLRHKAPPRSSRRSWAQSVSQTAIGNAPRRHFLGSGYPPLITPRQESFLEKTANSQANLRTFSPMYGLSRNADVPVHTFLNRPNTEGPKAGVAREATLAQESRRERGDNDAVGTPQSTWSNERTVVLGKKTETRATREQGRSRAETVQTRREEKMFDSKERASEERNLRWEELTKLDKEARQRESEQRDKAAGKESSKERRVRERDIPIRLEVSRDSRAEGTPKGVPTPLEKDAGDGPGREVDMREMRFRLDTRDITGTLQGDTKTKTIAERDIPIRLEVSRDSRAEGTPKGVPTPLKKDAGGGPGRGVDTRETKFRLDTRDTTGTLQDDAVTETIAESIVSSVLKRFTQSPEAEASADSFPDTKVTYVGRTELPGDKRTKTEIVLESKLTEEVDVADGTGLDYLLSRDAQGKVERRGQSTEQMIGDIINLGLKGRDRRARVVKVEMVEEPVSYVGGEEADEFSTPFRVEEADDMSPGSRGPVGEGSGETEVSFSVNQHQKTRLPLEHVAHVEEVMEAGDWEGEQSYFVSTPDEQAPGQDQEEGSVYGQIHIEEESTIRYSWQDEIVPASRRRLARDTSSGETVMEPPDVLEPGEGSLGSPHWIEETTSGEFHAEATVIDKEIKIPHEFHTSINRDFKEPRHQLVEVISQLEENLPARVKEELSALTTEGQGGLGHLSVDVKKVQTSGGGSMTLVAEVNLSQTVDTDQLDLEELSRDEAGEIEKVVESVVRDSLTKRHSPGPGSPDRDTGGAAPGTGFGFKRWATQELYSSSVEGDDSTWASRTIQRATSQGPVSATVEVTSPRGFAQTQVLEHVSQSVRRVEIGPAGIWRTERAPSEGPAAGEMDPSHIAATPSWTQEATVLVPAGPEAEADRRDDQAAGVSFRGQGQAEFDKTAQLQRMVDQRSVISDEKKVAVLYLDNQGDDDDGHWF